MAVTRARLRGVNTPLRFLAIRKNGGVQRRRFFHSCWTTFPHLSGIFLAQVTSGQVTRPGQVTPTSEKLCNCVTATVVERKT